MELCLIMPIEHIKHTSLLPGRFCLAQIADRSLPYKSYFDEAQERGYHVVLDNGAFEGQLIETNKLLELARDIKPSVLVAPDLFNGNAKENFDQAQSFAMDFPRSFYTELMFVPQCEMGDTNGFYNALDNAIVATNGRGQKMFKWIGICRNAVFHALHKYTNTKNESLNKFFFGAWAAERGLLEEAQKEGVKFHLLGLGDDFAMLPYMWWAARADTASLFFQATLGEAVSYDGRLSGKIGRPSDYFTRNFGPDGRWESVLRLNCKKALEYASTAGRTRDLILSGRI